MTTASITQCAPCLIWSTRANNGGARAAITTGTAAITACAAGFRRIPITGPTALSRGCRRKPRQPFMPRQTGLSALAKFAVFAGLTLRINIATRAPCATRTTIAASATHAANTTRTPRSASAACAAAGNTTGNIKMRPNGHVPFGGDNKRTMSRDDNIYIFINEYVSEIKYGRPIHYTPSIQVAYGMGIHRQLRRGNPGVDFNNIALIRRQITKDAIAFI